MRVSRSSLVHRLMAIAAAMCFAALTLGCMAWLHLAEHPGKHDPGHCSICLALSGQVKEVDPGAAVHVQSGQALSEPIRVNAETRILASPSFRLNARSPPPSGPV